MRGVPAGMLLFLWHCWGAAASVTVPTVKLRNGVDMPLLLMGVGSATWQNDTATAQLVFDALQVGFTGIDTASHYMNQKGVAQGISAAGIPRDDVWLSTKVMGCGHSDTYPMREGHCFEHVVDSGK